MTAITQENPIIWRNDRQRLLMRAALELLRKETGHRFSDWKDCDDWIFSELDFTASDLEEIYAQSGLPIHTGSAVTGNAPIGLGFDELKMFVNEPLTCREEKTAWGTVAVVRADIPGYPALFTDGDIPALTGYTWRSMRLRLEYDGTFTLREMGPRGDRLPPISYVARKTN